MRWSTRGDFFLHLWVWLESYGRVRNKGQTCTANRWMDRWIGPTEHKRYSQLMVRTEVRDYLRDRCGACCRRGEWGRGAPSPSSRAAGSLQGIENGSRDDVVVGPACAAFLSPRLKIPTRASGLGWLRFQRFTRKEITPPFCVPPATTKIRLIMVLPQAQLTAHNYTCVILWTGLYG